LHLPHLCSKIKTTPIKTEEKNNTIFVGEKMAKKYQPYDYQWPHIKKAEEYFLLGGNTRGKIISPCGTGKTHIGYYIGKHMAVSSTVQPQYVYSQFENWLHFLQGIKC